MLLSKVRTTESELEALSEVMFDLDEPTPQQDAEWKELSDAWQRLVVETGLAFADAMKVYGLDWERDYYFMGYHVSRSIARRYLACAKHPRSGAGSISVKQWAKASKRLARFVMKAKADAADALESKQFGPRDEFDAARIWLADKQTSSLKKRQLAEIGGGARSSRK